MKRAIKEEDLLRYRKNIKDAGTISYLIGIFSVLITLIFLVYGYLEPEGDNGLLSIFSVFLTLVVMSSIIYCGYKIAKNINIKTIILINTSIFILLLVSFLRIILGHSIGLANLIVLIYMFRARNAYKILESNK